LLILALCTVREFAREHRASVTAALIVFIAAVSCRVSGQSQNIARDCPYTMSPRPNYPLTTDPGDDRQLTDGVYAGANTMWLQKPTVGWENASPVTIVIDLRGVQPIGGVTFSTAAGTAGVEWPRSIFVLVSDDGRRYFPVADLTAPGSGNVPPPTGYARFRFTAQRLATHGRYVALLVDQDGPYTFCDEIEVQAGRPDAVRAPLTGEGTTDLQDFFRHARTRVSITRRLSLDLDEVRSTLTTAAIAVPQSEQLTRDLDRLGASIASTPSPDLNTFTTTLPLNELHAAIYAVHGAIGHSSGRPELSAWPANPWDFVRPFDQPPPARSREPVSIAAMNGETRAGAINVANSSSRPMTISLALSGLPPEAIRDLRLAEVVWTDTRDLVPVADALVPITSAKPSIVVPAGLTRQIWIAFVPGRETPGSYRGSIDLFADARPVVHVPVELKVLAGTLPERPALHLGGWDYSDATNLYGITPGNRTAFIEQLHALGIDSPWATSAVLPPGRYDTAGRMLNPPPTSAFDQWIADWPGASTYYVFVSAADQFGGAGIAANPRFQTAVAQWITFWVKHADARGVPASHLALLLVDEPHTPAQHARILEWARAIKAAAPAVRIWENPTDPDPGRSAPVSLDAVDVIALKSWLMDREGARFVDYYRRRAGRGQELSVYGASGPSRLLDPYSYYRLQAWRCADLGATSSFFWSFSDDAGGFSWNEYATTNTVYSPLFLGRDRITISKHSEAIREGREDFEYLTMLRRRIAAIETSDPRRPGLAAARDLLSTAATTVLGAPGARDEHWRVDKDRTIADRVRSAVAAAIEQLK